MNWEKEPLVLPALDRKIVKSELLTGGSVDVKQGADGITISVPAANRQEIDTIVKLQLDGPVGTAPLPVAKDPP
jgi:alpha-L-fucosidase